MSSPAYQTGHGRVYLQRSGAGPGNPLEYQGRARMGTFTVPKGDVTAVYAPSAKQYDRFDVVDEIRGEEGLPTTSIIARLSTDNPILTEHCSFHLQARYGKCGNPLDVEGGWELILGYEHATVTNISGEQQTAIQPEDRAVVLITGDVTARKLWEIQRLSLTEVAKTNITGEVVDIEVSDYISCGDCGYISDGEQRVFAVAKGSGAGSPGLSSELLISSDGGSTWSEYDIDTLAVAENPSAVTLIGTTIVVVSQDSISMHLASLSTPGTWSEVTTGFVAGGAPNDISSVDSAHTWIVGQGGYIYFIENLADGVETVQADGSAFSDNLTCVHALSENYLIAGGENGLLVRTTNGGSTWSEMTSPTVATINCVWMRDEYSWFVGTSNGRLYFTTDGGTTWTEKNFGSLTGKGEVFDLGFADSPDSPYGFMVISDASDNGYIFRTLDCGASWYQLPDYEGSTPSNHGLKCLSVGISGNFAITGGLATDDTDGIVVVAE